MTKKKRRGRRYGARVSEVRLNVRETTLQPSEFPRPSAQAIKRSPPARGGELAYRHRLALADVKLSLVIGGAMFALLVVLYLLLG